MPTYSVKGTVGVNGVPTNDILVVAFKRADFTPLGWCVSYTNTGNGFYNIEFALAAQEPVFVVCFRAPVEMSGGFPVLYGDLPHIGSATAEAEVHDDVLPIEVVVAPA